MSKRGVLRMKQDYIIPEMDIVLFGNTNIVTNSTEELPAFEDVLTVTSEDC